MTMLRVMILNYSNKEQFCKVTFPGVDKIEFVKCTRTTPAEMPTERIDAAPSGYLLKVPPGEICGFAALTEVTIENPAPDEIHVVTAAGKDPWPPPPPPPNGFLYSHDYYQRYKAFAPGGGGSSAGFQITISAISPPPEPATKHGKDIAQ